MFINFVALLWSFKLRNVIADKKLTSKYSARDLFRVFDGVKKIKIGGQWKLMHIIQKDAKILRKLELHPPLDILNIDIPKEDQAVGEKTAD